MKKLKILIFILFILWASGLFANLSWNLGDVIKGQIKTNVFKLPNNSSSVMKIKRVRPLCSCVKVIDYPKSILPGNTGKFSLALNTDKLAGKIYYETIVEICEPKVEMIKLILEATIVSDIKIFPASIDFGQMARSGADRSTNVLIHSRTNKRLSLPEMVNKPEWLDVNVINNGRDVILHVQLHTSGEFGYGPFTYNLKFSIDNYRGEEYLLRINGLIKCDLSGEDGTNEYLPRTSQICEETAPEMTINFYYGSRCSRCKETLKYIKEIIDKHKLPNSVLKLYNLNIVSNYLRLLTYEEKLDIHKNKPMALFIGTNYLYGARDIRGDFEQLLIKILKNNNICSEYDEININKNSSVEKRFDKITAGVVVIAGLADGINPCAFATLILFVTLMASYKRKVLDIIMATIAFALGIVLTYTLLGILIFSMMEIMGKINVIRDILFVSLGFASICLGIIGLRDAWRLKHYGSTADIILKLPKRLRTKIGGILKSKAGRRAVLLSIFTAGLIVAAIESVCTGQMYVPTLALMASRTSTRFEAIFLLILYNIMFILPIIFLSIVVIFGVRGIAMKISGIFKNHVYRLYFAESLVFIVIGIVLLLLI